VNTKVTLHACRYQREGRHIRICSPGELFPVVMILGRVSSLRMFTSVMQLDRDDGGNVNTKDAKKRNVISFLCHSLRKMESHFRSLYFQEDSDVLFECC
jgi:hypothetical protein